MNTEHSEINLESVQHDLHTRFVGQKIIYYASLASTMDAARMEANWGAQAGTVILAGEQTAGRGRLKRSWRSPSGGLAFSVILRPNISYLPYMIMLTSLAVVYAIRSVTGLNARIKWPNDVLIKGKKVCGILIETDIRKDELKHLVIGIGINVNMSIIKYPEISSIATSLSDQLNKPVSRVEILKSILIEMDELYADLPNSRLLFNHWKENLMTIGQEVQINTGNQTYKGKAESVMEDGSLMLRQKNGSLKKIIVGDVMFK